MSVWKTYLYKRSANIQLAKELIPHFVGKLAQCHLSLAFSPKHSSQK